MSRLSVDDWQQVEHVARLAVLAVLARGTAQAEHAAQDEISRMVVTVSDLSSPVPVVEVEYYGSHNIPIGGVSL